MTDEDQSATGVHTPRSEGRKRGRPFSEILRAIADDTGSDRVSVDNLLEAMGDRGFGPLMLVFAIPNLIPAPPGTSSVLGAPLVFLAAQLAFGKHPWLPRLIADRSMARADFAALVKRVNPWLLKAERLFRPRLDTLVRPPTEYGIGVLCLILAIILVLPIPLGNNPPALAICLFSFGILERDGVWVIAGFVTSVASLAIVGGVIVALIKGALFVFTGAFS
ncbi:exopolysaccharide biosynthesis protein [Allomesorhizobium camelthorni]|uniref:Exopolysaccharide biosynthesis protein n=1 Tax=Allomesorhizobium camelthorni TaxID=475069 RepID=A0A6G4WLX6_9HYPH|nr:exopolysaccharide biosynthesis protein [Mesorhizobium camelthorni]NGO55077.1 exopolysaccharide biosynthesis protein [Mesorhizobium camelthorni]